MRTRRAFHSGAATAALMVLVNTSPVSLSAQPTADPVMRVSENELGGVVAGPNGPEAGVWVIAETTELPTKFAKIVVTDERGRYLIPELPKAKYSVWVRGFGLVDSSKVEAAPGRVLDLAAAAAPNEKEAAQYYPAMYWYSLLSVPQKSEFPMPKIKSQGEWLNIIKSGACNSCHALGTPGMRTILPELGEFKSSIEAWQRRLMSGQAQSFMVRDITRLDTDRALAMFADWTDRIAAGELPFAKPERPQGTERNVVVTLWDWGSPTSYLHDVVSTDRRNPRLNANGKVYGSPEDSTDVVPILDPKTHTASGIKHPVRDPSTPSSRSNPMAPSPYWGAEPIWDSQTLNHNPMFDEKGRVWFTSRIRPPANPDYCKRGSEHPSAKLFPLDSGGRNLSFYDPATDKFTLIHTCFPTHHLNFGSDANQTLWLSAGVAGPGVLGWLNRKMYEETGDEVESQGWSPFVLDTNGNGRRDEYAEPNQPVDPAKDKRVAVNIYSVAISPADGSIWGSALGYPGYAVRVAPGADPTHTAVTEVYEPPAPGFGPAGRRHRSERRFLGVTRERPSRELRSSQMQGAQWAGGHRQALPGRLDAPSAARTAIPDGDRCRQRGSELLRLGRLVRHIRSRPQRADRHGQSQRLDLCHGRRQAPDAARALPDRHVRQERRRSHRRSERRLERQGALDDDRHAYSLPQ